MASSLSFSLDFKLLFDSLAEPNGCIRLQKLLKLWPGSEREGGAAPYIRHWKTTAQDGLLTWSAFSNGLQEAFKNDIAKLVPQTIATTTSTQELEKALLNNSSKANIINALTRTRKEVYKSQKSINNMTGSPRKALLEPPHSQRVHHRSYSSGQSLPKDMPSEEREKIVLHQLEELLRERTQDKGGLSSSSQAMINEVLKQLKSMLRMSSRAGGSHDQLNVTSTNPYATIRRSGSHRLRYPFPAGGTVLEGGGMVHRSVSLPGSHHTILPMDSEPPPPYSPTANGSVYTPSTINAKTSSVSMINLMNVGSSNTPHFGAPFSSSPSTQNSTRQTLEMWKHAQIEATQRRTTKELSKHYRSSPELSQEQQLTKEELQTAQMYGTLARRPSKKSSQHQQVKTSVDDGSQFITPTPTVSSQRTVHVNPSPRK